MRNQVITSISYAEMQIQIDNWLKKQEYGRLVAINSSFVPDLGWITNIHYI